MGKGKILLGMPKGFNRLGQADKVGLFIYRTFVERGEYNKFNVPVWKHLTKDGHTIVRGICPRLSWPWIHIFLENCITKIECLEITEKDMKEMD